VLLSNKVSQYKRLKVITKRKKEKLIETFLKFIEPYCTCEQKLLKVHQFFYWQQFKKYKSGQQNLQK
jgi:hypothetical protein